MKGPKLTEKTFGLVIASILILCVLVVLVVTTRYQRHLNTEHQLFEELQTTIDLVATEYQHNNSNRLFDEVVENIIDSANLVITVFQIHSVHSGSPYIDITISGHDPKNPKFSKTVSQRINYRSSDSTE